MMLYDLHNLMIYVSGVYPWFAPYFRNAVPYNTSRRTGGVWCLAPLPQPCVFEMFAL